MKIFSKGYGSGDFNMGAGIDYSNNIFHGEGYGDSPQGDGNGSHYTNNFGIEIGTEGLISDEFVYSLIQYW